MNSRLENAWTKIFMEMHWQGMTCPDETEEVFYNKSSNDPDYLINDFCDDFKARIQNKTTVHFEIKPSIETDIHSIRPAPIEIYNLKAKYKVW